LQLEQNVLLSDSIFNISNAKELLEQSIRNSMASEWQFMIPDDVFSYQDDGKTERSYFKED
jgi:hypothetical protein